MWHYWVTIAIACSSQVANAQYKLDHNCAVNRQLALNKAAVPVPDAGVQFIPDCGASGIDYRPLQCLAWDFCACSSAEGRMLTNWTRGLKGCDCLVAQDKAKQVGSFVPQCDSMDRFAELQCNEQNGRCWRVDPHTGLVVRQKKRYPSNPNYMPPREKPNDLPDMMRKRDPVNNRMETGGGRKPEAPPPFKRYRQAVNVMLSNGTLLGTAMALNETLVILKEGDLDKFAPQGGKCQPTLDIESRGAPLNDPSDDSNLPPLSRAE